MKELNVKKITDIPTKCTLRLRRGWAYIKITIKEKSENKITYN